jgi:lactate racemase
MRVKMAFGQPGLTIELPAGPSWKIIESRTVSPLRNTDTALAHALDHPLETAGLTNLAKGKSSAAIAVCDITRPAPNPMTLPPLLDRLQMGGIPADRITIFVATGLHRPATSAELDVILGPAITRNFRIVNHNARDLDSHVFLGNTRRGTPVYIQEDFIAADLHITLGFIEQHVMAGFSGGRKLIAPGLAAEQTIKVLHSPIFMRDPAAIEGSINRNTLHAELLEIASMARHDFVLDVALTRAREIAGIFAGDGRKAHAAGMEFVRNNLLELLSDPVDAVITTGAGYPLDLTFYQTTKGVTAAQHIVKPGGKILVMGECSEGVGSSEFAASLAKLTSFEHFLQLIERSSVEIDQWQVEKIALAGRRFEMLFYTPGVARDSVGGLSERLYPTYESALDALLMGLPKSSRIAVLPDGPYVFAQLKRRTAMSQAEQSF